MATSKPLRFEKYQGLGNDFIVVDAEHEGDVSVEVASRLCDRRLGVGGDGVLLVLPPRDGEHVARMRVINADGSVPEMCGNGLRCVALHVARGGESAAARGSSPRAGADPSRANDETDAGSRLCQVELSADGLAADVAVAMGQARVLGERVIELGEREPPAKTRVVHVDMGNPHAVLFDPVTRLTSSGSARSSRRTPRSRRSQRRLREGAPRRSASGEGDAPVAIDPSSGSGRRPHAGLRDWRVRPVAAACDRGLAPFGEG